ncbi:MAG: glycoside hydrolase family 57 protein [Ferruginibacter sp.]
MPSITLYFKIHQPYSLVEYGFNDIEVQHSYNDLEATKKNISHIADECYLPSNKILLELLRSSNEKFKIAFSISGITLEILEQYRPDVLKSFRRLVRTGCVEILAETYYNSLSWLHSKKEFERQVAKHDVAVKRLLGTAPVVFRNTELIYSNELAKYIANLGYKGILCEGLQRILKNRTPNQVYASPGNGDFGVLLRNVNLSDDIAFRFDDVNWNEYPLTAEKFAQWIHSHHGAETNINLFMDYETFGIHKKKETGIFDFLKAFPEKVLADDNFKFTTPSEVLQYNYPKDIYDVPTTISWEDKSKENCVWCENTQQNNTLKKIYSIENTVYANGDDANIETWGRLQCADYIYNMNVESPGHKQNIGSEATSQSAATAYRNYTNILTDFEVTLIRNNLKKYKQHSTLINNLY